MQQQRVESLCERQPIGLNSSLFVTLQHVHRRHLLVTNRASNIRWTREERNTHKMKCARSRRSSRRLNRGSNVSYCTATVRRVVLSRGCSNSFSPDSFCIRLPVFHRDSSFYQVRALDFQGISMLWRHAFTESEHWLFSIQRRIGIPSRLSTYTPGMKLGGGKPLAAIGPSSLLYEQQYCVVVTRPPTASSCYRVYERRCSQRIRSSPSRVPPFHEAR